MTLTTDASQGTAEGTAADEATIAGLEKQYGADLILQYAVTPELLGGLRIRVGNDVFDGSVQNRIARLAAAF